MRFSFEVMTPQQAETIAYDWQHEGIYSFYDMKAHEEDLAEFLDSAKRSDAVYVVTEQEELVRFSR